MSENQKFVAVIVTYNRKKLLVETIAAILEQSLPPYKLVVIDNHSADGTKELLKELNYLEDKRIDYIRLPENTGGAGGFFEGTRHAIEKYEFDWLFLTDDDALPSKNYFSEIYKKSLKNPKIFAYSGTVYYENGTPQYDQRKIVTNKVTLLSRGLTDEEIKKDTLIDIAAFNGLVVNKKIVEKIGYPKKEYFIWFDDVEYSLRMNKYTKIDNLASINVLHKTEMIIEDGSSLVLPSWKYYYGARNRTVTQLLYSKSKWLYIGSLFVKNVIFTIRYLFQSKYKGNRKHFLIMLYRGTADALKQRLGKNVNYLPGKRFT